MEKGYTAQPGDHEPVKRRDTPTLHELQSSEAGRELCGFYQRVDALQTEIYDAHDAHKKDTDEQTAQLGIEPILSERYQTADLLLRAVKAVLEDEIGGTTPLAESPRYLEEKIGNALSPFGLKVVPDEETMDKKQRLSRRGVRRLLREQRANNRIIPNTQEQEG